MTGAQLSVTEMRGATRHPVDLKVMGEHRRLGDVQLHIVNLSANGFMANGTSVLDRGERITIRLAIIGRIEAHQIWCTEDRAGFQFERILRADDFLQLVDTLQPNPRLRGPRGIR